ncbi:YciI family protein [Phenylobacterium sp. 20VBR1]|uniref:YciI family protein n=2 Tax=Phenylobacterium glaciei TaxID=2803784 RepID=A0A941D560_9CAUL|nr:YciI family protein [Phenylobacterium glaciei]MBR7621116.1 YciI family protein [Phenylobacterium glaciei]
MQYMLLVYEPERLNQGAEGQARLMEVSGKHMALAKAMSEAGAMQAGAGLQPVATATTVRTSAGGQTLHDGPFAETREHLGGFYMIEAADLDEAIKWARQVPVRPGGSCEVRPVATH